VQPDAGLGERIGDSEVSELILSVEDLTVSFDGFKAVDGLNFYVEKDELRCVIGPNGAGKTTLLDMICGKTKPSGGVVRFKNYNLTGMIEYQITRAGRRAQVSDSERV
jgi:urea transport system ATP-binding protein